MRPCRTFNCREPLKSAQGCLERVLRGRMGYRLCLHFPVVGKLDRRLDVGYRGLMVACGVVS
jgi:hypothetical protein